MSINSALPDWYRPMAAMMNPAGLLVIDDLASDPRHRAGQEQLLLLLQDRQAAGLPTFFVGESLQALQERLTPELLELLLDDAVVREVYGPHLHLLMAARHHPEQSKQYSALYDAYASMRKLGQDEVGNVPPAFQQPREVLEASRPRDAQRAR